MHNDFRRVEARLMRDALARVLRRAGEDERFRAVESGGISDFARLVRVDLCFKKDRPSDDGSSDTPQGGFVGGAYAAESRFGCCIGFRGRLRGLLRAC